MGHLINGTGTASFPALLSRKYDAIIATMDITESARKVDFTQKYQHPGGFAAKERTEIQLDKAFMDGKTIAVQRCHLHGYLHHRQLPQRHHQALRHCG